MALLSLSAHAQWTNEQVIHATNLNAIQTSPKVVCANMANYKVLDCVYPDYSASVGNTTIMEIQSTDGGVTWGAPSQVSSDVSYDPYVEYDSRSGHLNLAYARGSGLLNDIVVRTKTSPNGGWSGSTLVMQGNGGSAFYWIPSILTLYDGTINVYATLNGPESPSGIGSGRIMVSSSNNGGASYTAPVAITNTCDAEYARATQNQYGTIFLLFTRYVDNLRSSPCADGIMPNGYTYSDLHAIYSDTDGATWHGESTMYHNPNGMVMHPFISKETTAQQTPCPGCQMDMFWFGQNAAQQFAVFEMQSSNQGGSFSSPIQQSQTTWTSAPGNMDPGFAIGCRGFFMFYTDAYPYQNIYDRRYDFSQSCSIN